MAGFASAGWRGAWLSGPEAGPARQRSLRVFDLTAIFAVRLLAAKERLAARAVAAGDGRDVDRDAKVRIADGAFHAATADASPADPLAERRGKRLTTGWSLLGAASVLPAATLPERPTASRLRRRLVAESAADEGQAGRRQRRDRFPPRRAIGQTTSEAVETRSNHGEASSGHAVPMSDRPAVRRCRSYCSIARSMLALRQTSWEAGGDVQRTDDPAKRMATDSKRARSTWPCHGARAEAGRERREGWTRPWTMPARPGRPTRPSRGRLTPSLHAAERARQSSLHSL
jgi:hypothetical protein